MSNKRHLHNSYHLENSKGFRSSVRETGTKVKYVFLIINHNIIACYVQEPS